jgi:hypothetical protein
MPGTIWAVLNDALGDTPANTKLLATQGGWGSSLPAGTKFIIFYLFAYVSFLFFLFLFSLNSNPYSYPFVYS